eukprot:839088-Prorocentrum_minimum.AAC.1
MGTSRPSGRIRESSERRGNPSPSRSRSGSLVIESASSCKDSDKEDFVFPKVHRLTSRKAAQPAVSDA